MTIGLILDDTLDRSDGVQQAVIAIGEKLRVLGHDVHYICSETKRTDLQNIHSVGKFIPMKFNGNSIRTPLPASGKKIKQLFSEVDFDVLHVTMPYSPLLAEKVLKLAPSAVKKFGTFHILPFNKLSDTGTSLLGFALRSSLKSMDHCFAVSAPALNFMQDSFNVDGTVLANPVDFKFFRKYKKQKSDKFTFVFVGRFEERKGVKQLVEAFDKADINGAKLIMCGKGPMLDDVVKDAKSRNLDIEFPGFVEDEEKAQYLANADVAVFPSTSGESFGIVLTEAMSAKSGIAIGGNNPGYDSVIGKWPEVLFDPNDINEFAQLLRRCATDKEFRESIGSEQHEYAKEFDIDYIVDELLRYYS